MSENHATTTDVSSEIAALQEKLAQIEQQYEPLRRSLRKRLKAGEEWTQEMRNAHDAKWQAIGQEAAAVRGQLSALTGDAYGRPKVKLVRPDSEELDAQYASADEIPQHVRAWIQKHGALLTNDATDAVRLMRIANTLEDERYPEGEVTIYRAIGRGDHLLEEIRPGDWVTTDRAYAEEHLSRWLDGRGQILEETVDGRDVLTSPTGNHEEAIYAPRDFSGPIQAPAAPTKRRTPGPGL